MQIIETLSPNFSVGRKGRVPIAIISHITAGLMPGTLSWLQNPVAQASAHYLVTKDGKIFQLVNNEDTAWHVGIVNQPNWILYDGTNPNRYTIGIEHECESGGELTEIQYQATFWLHRQLITEFGIPIDRDHITGHYAIDSINRPNCPGPDFPWNKLMSDLNPKPQQIINIKANGKILAGIVINNVSYCPVRLLAESLGYLVNWDASTNSVIIPPVNISVIYTKEVKIVTRNMVVPVFVLNEKTYAPVRDLSVALGFKVNWDADTNSVIITK